MTTTPEEPVEDPQTVPSGDPFGPGDPIPAGDPSEPDQADTPGAGDD